MSRLRHLGWDQCSHGLTSGPLESCHHQCLKAVCGVLGCPSGAAVELLDGTLMLRYCTTSFTKRFPPGLFMGMVGGLVKREDGSAARLLDGGGNAVNPVPLTRKTCPGNRGNEPPRGQLRARIPHDKHRFSVGF